MTPNQTLSKQLEVTPLKPDEVATFVLVSVAKKEIGRDEPTTPWRVQLSGKQNVTDHYDGNMRKTIANVVGSLPITENGRPRIDEKGRPMMMPEVKGVIFEHGFVKITSEYNNTYQYLMRRLDNQSNPFRKVMGGKNVAPRFKLVEDKKELQDLLHKKEMFFLAQKLVRETSFTNLQAMAHKLNESPDHSLHVAAGSLNDPQKLKLEMIQKAEQYAKFVINASDDQPSRCKVQIYHCEELGIIRFDQGAFYLLGKDYKEIHKPAADKDPVDSLVDFFLNDKNGRGKYQDMADALVRAFK